MAQDPMAEIRASFFVECEELLESLQDSLAALEAGDEDAETINTVFRAVHSIKGGAGAFALSALVAFAHRFETVLDALRAGRLALTPSGLKLFFVATDLLADEVRAAQDGAAEPAGAEEALCAIEALLGEAPAEEMSDAEVESGFQPLMLSFDFDTDVAEGPTDADAETMWTPELAPALEQDAPPFAIPDNMPPEVASSAAEWEVIFRPHSELYASGNEPLHLLRALRRLGAAAVFCDMTDLPALEALLPESACLAWRLRIDGTVSEAEIREIFDFVDDVSSVEIRRLAEPDPEPVAETFHVPSGPAPATIAAQQSRPSADDASASSMADAPARETLMEVEAAPFPTIDAESLPEDGQTPSAACVPASRPADTPAATVRVDIGRLDRLVNLVGELVVNQAMLSQSVAAAGLPANSPVMNGLEAFVMLTRDIQDSMMMIRAQPVKPLFQRMARIVREASAHIGKEARLRTTGEATEVDKTVIERLADPLTHMIRNAVDHGLETPEARRAAGKPPEGLITLSAQHRSGRVVIEVSDDGGGIDRARVQAIAAAKGLVQTGAALNESEIDNLLFLPGFSTAGKISNLSGRGVGMDVVRSAIRALGGRISISSEPGRGTTFSISLPLTLAVLDGMVVEVAGETLVVPLSAVIETTTLARTEIRSIGPGREVVHLRGGFVPLYDLGHELGYRERAADTAGAVVLLTAQDDGSRSALIVDSILDQRQVVIKGLEQSYGPSPGIAAATILGNGQVALILDPADLVTWASGRNRLTDLACAG